MSASFLQNYTLDSFQPMDWQWDVINYNNVVNFLHCGARSGKSELAYCLTIRSLSSNKKVLWVEGLKRNSVLYGDCISHKLKKLQPQNGLHRFGFNDGELSFLFLLRNKFELAYILNYDVVFIEQAEVLNDYIFAILYQWVVSLSCKPKCKIYILGRAVDNVNTNYAKLASVGVSFINGDFLDFKPVWEFKHKYCRLFRVPIQANPYLAEKDFSSIKRETPIIYKKEYLAKY